MGRDIYNVCIGLVFWYGGNNYVVFVMKILFFSDLHAHPFKEGHILDDGLNSRLTDCINAMDEIYAFALYHDIKVVCFGGDLFHTRKRVDTAAFNEVHAVLSEYSGKHGIRTYLLVGNHDQYDRLGKIHALASFDSIPNVTVVDKLGWFELEKYVHLCAIPYIHNTKTFLTQLSSSVKIAGELGGYRIGFFHVGIDGTKVGQGKYAYSIDSEIAIGDLQPKVWDQVLLGHYHTQQSLVPNVHYIGAPLQHTWADEGESRGFIVLDTKSNTIKRLVVEGTPRFITLQHPISDNVKINDNDFVRVVFTETPTDEELKKIKETIGKVSISVKPIKREMKRSTISLSDSRQEVLKKYLRLKKEQTKVKLRTLLKEGVKYI